MGVIPFTTFYFPIGELKIMCFEASLFWQHAYDELCVVPEIVCRIDPHQRHHFLPSLRRVLRILQKLPSSLSEVSLKNNSFEKYFFEISKKSF